MNGWMDSSIVVAVAIIVIALNLKSMKLCK